MELKLISLKTTRGVGAGLGKAGGAKRVEGRGGEGREGEETGGEGMEGVGNWEWERGGRGG